MLQGGTSDSPGVDEFSRSGAARESEKSERPDGPGRSRITRSVSLSRRDGRVLGRIALAIAGVDPELPGVRLEDPEHVLVALFLLVALVDDVIDAAVLEVLLVEQPVGAEVVLARLPQRLEPGDALERPIAVLLRGKLVVGLLLLLETLPDMEAPAVVAAVGAIVMDRHLALGQLEVLGRRRKRERRGHQQPGEQQKFLESFDHDVLPEWRSENLLRSDTCQDEGRESSSRPRQPRTSVPGFDLRAEADAIRVAAEGARRRRGDAAGALAHDPPVLRRRVPVRVGQEGAEHRAGEVGATGAREGGDGRSHRELEQTEAVGVAGLGSDAVVTDIGLDLEVVIELNRGANANAQRLVAYTREGAALVHVRLVLVDEHQGTGNGLGRLIDHVLDDAPLFLTGVGVEGRIVVQRRGGPLPPLKSELVEAAEEIRQGPLDREPGADRLASVIGRGTGVPIRAVDVQGDARLQRGAREEEGNPGDPEVGTPERPPLRGARVGAVVGGAVLHHGKVHLDWTDWNLVEACAESRDVPVEEVDLVDVVAVVVPLPDPVHAASREGQSLGADPVLAQSDLVVRNGEAVEVRAGVRRHIREHAVIDELDAALVLVEALAELPLRVVLALVAEAELVVGTRVPEADLGSPFAVAADAAAEVSVEVHR